MNDLLISADSEITDYTIRSIPYDPAEVIYHLDGRWVRKATVGDTPKPTSAATAQVLGHTMVVICGHDQASESCHNDIFALNLRNWEWTRLSPEGVPPLRCDKLSSWTHGGKVYGFGGFGEDDQVVYGRGRDI